MAKLTQEQALNIKPQQLLPVYVVAGDEALLVEETCDALRAKAREAGFVEREIFYTDAGFQWHELSHSANSLSLFSDKKLLEIRLHNGKPGDLGSKALQAYCEHPPEDNLLLIISPKLERSSQNSKWYKALDSLGGMIHLWPISEQQLPSWIGQRLRREGLRADSQAIDTLASRVEGNLLAAKQEIEKLKLFAKDGIIDNELMSEVVVDSSRYNIFSLVDKALAANGKEAVACLNGLRGEGSEATVILWALNREIRTLYSLRDICDSGQRLEAHSKRHGVFDKRLPIVRSAIQRLKTPTLRLLLEECSNVDLCIKGMAKGNPWDLLLDIVLTLSGSRCLSGPTLRELLEMN